MLRKRKKKTSSGVAQAPDERIVLTVYLKRPDRKRRRPGSAADLEELTQRVSREQLAAKRKRMFARPIAAVRRFARLHRMKLLDIDPTRCRLTLSLRPADAERAFAIALQKSESSATGIRRVRRACRNRSRMSPKLCLAPTSGRRNPACATWPARTDATGSTRRPWRASSYGLAARPGRASPASASARVAERRIRQGRYRSRLQGHGPRDSDADRRQCRQRPQ